MSSNTEYGDLTNIDQDQYYTEYNEVNSESSNTNNDATYSNAQYNNKADTYKQNQIYSNQNYNYNDDYSNKVDCNIILN